MAKKFIQREIHTQEDAEGNISVDTKETTYEALAEPDYIKIYTKMWCTFKEIPEYCQKLFMELVMRMSYCNSSDLDHSQIVYTGMPVSKEIQSKLNWKPNMYQKSLKALCEFGAIKKINRGVYQINPEYAGKGGWKYNPKANQGGIKDLVATFNFKNGKVETKMLWADDGEDTELNQIYRKGLEVTKNQDATLMHIEFKQNSTDEILIPGQMSIQELEGVIV